MDSVGLTLHRLLERGAYPCAADKNFINALMYAAQGGRLPVVERLRTVIAIKRGADPSSDH